MLKPGGFGVLGDSSSDEYQADDNRGGAYAATTLNWWSFWPTIEASTSAHGHATLTVFDTSR
jgi:hypothetical protein